MGNWLQHKKNLLLNQSQPAKTEQENPDSSKQSTNEGKEAQEYLESQIHTQSNFSEMNINKFANKKPKEWDLQGQECIQILKQGNFGTVQKVKENGKYYALKEIQIGQSKSKMPSDSKYSKDLLKCTIREQTFAKRLLDCKHQNIVHFYDTFRSPKDAKKLQIKMELCEHSLTDFISSKKFTHDEILQILMDILNGQIYLLSQHIIHRDIKPGNILFVSSEKRKVAKLCDFGLSKEVDNFQSIEVPSGPRGSLPYMSPQNLQNCFNSNTVNCNSLAGDIWSFGIILFELVFNCRPFPNEENPSNLYHYIQQNPVHLLKGSCKFDQKIIDLINGMLKFEEENRLKLLTIVKTFNQISSKFQIPESSIPETVLTGSENEIEMIKVNEKIEIIEKDSSTISIDIQISLSQQFDCLLFQKETSVNLEKIVKEPTKFSSFLALPAIEKAILYLNDYFMMKITEFKALLENRIFLSIPFLKNCYKKQVLGIQNLNIQEKIKAIFDDAINYDQYLRKINELTNKTLISGNLSKICENLNSIYEEIATTMNNSKDISDIIAWNAAKQAVEYLRICTIFSDSPQDIDIDSIHRNSENFESSLAFFQKSKNS